MIAGLLYIFIPLRIEKNPPNYNGLNIIGQ